MRKTRSAAGVPAIAASLALAAGVVTVVMPATAVNETPWIDAGALALSAATGEGVL